MTELLSADVLVINQKAKLVELTNEYLIRDPQGLAVGSIRQENQSALRKVLRFVSKIDAILPVSLAVYDAHGNRVLHLTRGLTLWKSKLEVADGAGASIGRITQLNIVGKIRFGFEDRMGNPVGEIRAENWRAWNFSIVDGSGNEVGRITKKWAGFGKELFTTADNYVFEVNGTVDPAFRLLMLAGAASIDTVLKQSQG